MIIQADPQMHFKTLNQQVRDTADSQIVINGCIGQRYIGAGSSGKEIIINGTPGNALGACLDGSDIIVHGNAQDATGDTMNQGHIVIHGSSGDATGYGMRGGKIFVRDNAGYRGGIHMKTYQDKLPVLVIGGMAGSFLGEYQAGGLIVVLGKGADKKPPIGYFCGTGMHGGRIFLRCEEAPSNLPAQVSCEAATPADLALIRPHLAEFCSYFTEYGESLEDILNDRFYVLSANTKNPYKRLYTYN